MQSPNTFSLRILAVALLVSLAAACQPYTLVKSGVRTPVGNGMTVAPEKSWNQLGNQFTGRLHSNVEVWTADSQFLNELVFVGGLEDGEKILGHVPNSPSFSSNASILDLAEFARSTFSAAAKSSAKELKTQPITFLGGDGVLTEFDLPYADGAPGRGLAAVTIKNDKLYMIAWRGVGDLYYNGRKAEVEAMIKSARLGTKV